MPSPNTLPTATGECGKSWKWYVSRRFSGRLYVHDSETKTSYWLDDVCLGFKKYNKYLADSRPEQKAGGSGDETDSLQARYQPLCRDFRRGCCRRKSCRFRHEVSHGAPVREKYAAADAAPVPPLRGHHYCEAVLGICEDYARGYCRRGEDCPLRHEEVPLGDCKHFFIHRTCKYGDTCKFRHGTLSNAKFDAAAETQPRYCRRGQACHLWHEETEAAHVCDVPRRVCRHFVRGTCRFGDRCKYRHVTLSDEMDAASEMQ